METFYEFAELLTARKYVPTICGFKEWLLSETQTISQFLQSQDPAVVKEIKKGVMQTLMQQPFFQGNQKMIDRFANFFTHINLGSYGANVRLDASSVLAPGAAVETRQQWQKWGDYFVANAAKVFNKLNTIEYTPQIVDQEVEDWHEELATKQRGLPSEKYQVALTLDHIGWKGWKWVDLERGFCDEEGRAMGHCGNANVAEGDTILSLRDQDEYAHLTFIVNDKMLGEAKGRSNNKPSDKYHPAIVELLKSKYINAILGGGYKPENNFHLEDLPKDQQEQLRKQKPYLDDYFGYLIDHNKVDQLGEMIGAPNLKYEEPEFIITQYDQVEKTSWQKPILDAKTKKPVLDKKGEPLFKTQTNYGMTELIDREDRERGGDSDFTAYFGDQMYDLDWGPANIGYLTNDISKENEKKLNEYFAKMQPETHEEESLESLIEEDDEIRSAFENAYSDGMMVGTQEEVFKDVSSQLLNGDQNGFSIDLKKHPFKLIISKNDLQDFYKTRKDDIAYYEDITQLVDFNYSKPYNGYSDFDEETFNERLSELLDEF